MPPTPTGQINGTSNLEFLINLPPQTTKVVMEGSSRSSKTYSILQWLVLFKLTKIDNFTVTCWRFNAATHKTTTIATFKEVMGNIGLAKGIPNYFDAAGDWKAGAKEYHFPNGSMLAFDGTMDPQKIQGRTQDISWYNEVMEISQAAFNQASMRTKRLQIFDFNPSFNHHWVFDSVMTIQDGSLAYKHSTYKDNESNMSASQIAEIEKYDPSNKINVHNGTADQWQWDVYGLGKRGKVQGAIFSNWEIWRGDWPDPFSAQRFGYGLDFGFSLDPSALIECTLHQDFLYLKEMIYEPELLITQNITEPWRPSIQTRMQELEVSQSDKIYADSAQPESITDLRASGYNVNPCQKGKGSILEGVELLKTWKFRVHPSSMNLQIELEHYRWRKKLNSTGEDIFTREPMDEYNHLLDGARYWGKAELQRAKKETRDAQRGRSHNTTIAKNTLARHRPKKARTTLRRHR